MCGYCSTNNGMYALVFKEYAKIKGHALLLLNYWPLHDYLLNSFTILGIEKKNNVF